MRKKKFPILSIVLYTLAGLLMLYTVWAAVYYFNYISEMIAQNQLVIKGNEFEIVNFLMSSFAQYGLLTVILLALGRIIHINTFGIVGELDEENQVSTAVELNDGDNEEDDFEDWFSEQQ